MNVGTRFTWLPRRNGPIHLSRVFHYVRSRGRVGQGRLFNHEVDLKQE
jgi:hypothetical protein